MKTKSKPKDANKQAANVNPEPEVPAELIEEAPAIPIMPEIPEPINEVPTVTAESRIRPPSDKGEPGSTSMHHVRVTKNLWQVCCNEVAAEMTELSSILTKLGLPPVNYSKDKCYPLTDYEEAPDLDSAKSKDFLDFWVFPTLLPAIQSLLQFAKMNRVFQCRYCSFNSLDYIVEYLYNNNPRYPERLDNPTPLFEIDFVKKWLAKYPRPPLPKWLTMTDGEAATVIQRAIRGFLVRVRPDVQEMRQFWKDFKKDAEAEKFKADGPEEKPSAELFSPYYSEISGEFDTKSRVPTPDNTHSDTCQVCARFKLYLEEQRILKQNNAGLYAEESGGSDFYDDEVEGQGQHKNQHTSRNRMNSGDALVNAPSKIISTASASNK